MTTSNTTPVYAVQDPNLVPVSSYLKDMQAIPPSRMFLINKSLKVVSPAMINNKSLALIQHSRGSGFDCAVFQISV
ncbi:MAG: hypothetical protein WCP19_04555, partial [Chloroflexota bacterium]